MITIFESISEFINSLLKYIPVKRIYNEANSDEERRILFYSDDFEFQLSIVNKLVSFNIISRRSDPCTNNIYTYPVVTNSVMNDNTIQTIVRGIMLITLIPIDAFKNQDKTDN